MPRALRVTEVDAQAGVVLRVPDTSSPSAGLADANETRSRRIAWAKLLPRVFAVDAQTCPRCTEPMKIIAFVTEHRSLARQLAHAGLSTEIPPIASARAPPPSDWAFQPA